MLSGFPIVINIIMIGSSRFLCIRYVPKLIVEPLQLSSLNKNQKAAYSKLTTDNAKSNPGVSGEAVISLMVTYNLPRLKDMSCIVLRVYRPPKENNDDSEIDSWEYLDEEISFLKTI